MKKKKGSALIITICIMSLVIVLATSLLTTTVSNNLLTKKYDDVNKVKLITESGIEKAFAFIKDSVATNDPNLSLNDIDLKKVKENLGNFSFAENEENLKCNVSYITDKSNIVEIVSNGQTSNNKTHKKITVDIDLKTLVDNNASKTAMNNSLTVVDKVSTNSDESKNTFISGNNNILYINGSCYFQGNNIDITPIRANINSDFTIKSNKFDIHETKPNDWFMALYSFFLFDHKFEGQINADITDIIESNIDPESMGYKPFNYIKAPNISINYIKLNEKKLLNVNDKEGCEIKTSDDGMDSVILYKSSGNGKLSDIIENINKNESEYADGYKIILYNGNLTIDNYKLRRAVYYDRCIIYCTGKITIGDGETFNNINMQHSIICSKSIEIIPNTQFKINTDGTIKDDDDYNDNIGKIIMEQFGKNLDGYYDNIDAAITSWKEN